MAKGGKFSGMGGMGNMNNMMKQAQKMQQDMLQKQEELQQQEFEVSAGGGAITVIATGKKDIKSIKIKPEVVDADDVEMLEDLVLAAVNEALRKVEEASSSQMSKLMGGMNIPGLF